jgi:hypothetical protein
MTTPADWACHATACETAAGTTTAGSFIPVADIDV